MSSSISESQRKKFKVELTAVLRKWKYRIRKNILDELFSVIDVNQNGLLDDDELKLLVEVTFEGLKTLWANDRAKRELLDNIPVDDIALAIGYGCPSDANGEVTKENFLNGFLGPWSEMVEFYETLCNSLQAVQVFESDAKHPGTARAFSSVNSLSKKHKRPLMITDGSA